MSGCKHRIRCYYVVVFLFIFYPFAVTWSQEKNQPLEIIVKRGDSLSSIVIRETGNTDPRLWKKVADFNNRSVEQTLEIGDILLLPADLFEPQLLVVQELKEQALVNQPEDQPEDQLEPVSTGTGNAATSALPTDGDECDGQQVCFDVEVSTVEPTVRNKAEVEKLSTVDNPEQQQPDTSSAPEDSAPVVSSVETVADDGTADSESDPKIKPVVPIQPEPPQPKPEPAPKPTPKPTPKPETKPEPARQADASPPPAKPGLFEVDEDSAVRALERSLIQLNALLLRPRRAEITLNYDYSVNEDANPVLVSVEDVATNTTVQQVGQIKSEVQNNTVALDMKFGLPYDSQISLRLPMTFIDRQVGVVVPGAAPDDQDSSSNGVGDFAITLDKTLAVERGRRPDIIVSATYNSDTGADEIGSDANELSLGIRATKRQDPLVFTGSLSQTISQESDAGVTAGNITQFSIGTLLAASPYTSLQFLFNQALVSNTEVDGQSVPNSDGNIASFAAGVSSVLGRDLFLNAQLSIGLVDRASDYRLSFSLAKQFSF